MKAWVDEGIEDSQYLAISKNLDNKRQYIGLWVGLSPSMRRKKHEDKNPNTKDVRYPFDVSFKI